MFRIPSLLAGTAMLISTAYAQGPDMVFIAPNLGEKQCFEQTKPVVQSFFENATRNESLSILNAQTITQVTKLSVPDSNLYDTANPRRTERKNSKALAALSKFCKQPATAEPSMLYHEGLRYVGNNRPNQEPMSALFIGPPKAIDPKAGNLSMHGALVPNDGFFFAPRIQSPFSILEEEKLLEGVSVHLSTGGNDWAITPSHKVAAERNFANSVLGRGGVLGSIATDIGTVFDRIDSGATHQLSYDPINYTDQKLIMLDYAGPPPTQHDLFERMLTNAPLNLAELEHADNVSIGISWDSAVDVDLYITVSPDAPPLYYANRDTTDGRFLKDYRTNNARNGYETVELSRPVNLNTLMIAANLFGGKAVGGVNGKVRIAVGHNTYEAPFQITAENGDRGTHRNLVIENQTSPNANWTIIKPVEIIGAIE